MQSVRLFRCDNVVRLFRPLWDSYLSHKCSSCAASKKEDKCEADPYEGNINFRECDQFMKVTVIGAAGRVGRNLSMLLKTCPFVDQLCLFDTDKAVKGIGVDISHIDTKCRVDCVYGMRNIKQALEAPDVVVIAAGCPTSPELTDRKLFDKNAPIVAGLSEACARFCPKACVVLVTSPINSLLPVVGEIFQLVTNRIPQKKLFGLTTLDVVRANTFVAEVVRMDPNNVIVPVIGGNSQDTIVPVISQMKPCCKIKLGEMIALTECVKRAEGNLSDCQNCGTPGASSLSTAYAAFRFTSSLVMALKGAENIIECAFVKSNVIPELEYLASPLHLGAKGVEHNFGYPPLSDYEVGLMERAADVLKNDIDRGKSFVTRDFKKQTKYFRRCSSGFGSADDCSSQFNQPEEKKEYAQYSCCKTPQEKKEYTQYCCCKMPQEKKEYTQYCCCKMPQEKKEYAQYCCCKMPHGKKESSCRQPLQRRERKACMIEGVTKKEPKCGPSKFRAPVQIQIILNEADSCEDIGEESRVIIVDGDKRKDFFADTLWVANSSKSEGKGLCEGEKKRRERSGCEAEEKKMAGRKEALQKLKDTVEELSNSLLEPKRAKNN